MSEGSNGKIQEAGVENYAVLSKVKFATTLGIPSDRSTAEGRIMPSAPC